VRRKIMADEIGPEKDAEQVEEVEVLDEADGTALPETGASSGGFLCCSSSSSSSCCSAS
jgi:thiazolylpeptide-type bacteriocin precursor